MDLLLEEFGNNVTKPIRETSKQAWDWLKKAGQLVLPKRIILTDLEGVYTQAVVARLLYLSITKEDHVKNKATKAIIG
jgi:hypothetical protein